MRLQMGVSGAWSVLSKECRGVAPMMAGGSGFVHLTPHLQLDRSFVSTKYHISTWSIDLRLCSFAKSSELWPASSGLPRYTSLPPLT